MKHLAFSLAHDDQTHSTLRQTGLATKERADATGKSFEHNRDVSQLAFPRAVMEAKFVGYSSSNAYRSARLDRRAGTWSEVNRALVALREFRRMVQGIIAKNEGQTPQIATVRPSPPAALKVRIPEPSGQLPSTTMADYNFC